MDKPVDISPVARRPEEQAQDCFNAMASQWAVRQSMARGLLWTITNRR